jgi:hypothetical protein
MSDEGKPIQPEHPLKKVVWRGVVAIGETMEKSTTWTIAGVAAIAGLVIGQLASVSAMIPIDRIRLSLILLTASILIGAISKQVGMALAAGLKSIKEVEELLSDERYIKFMAAMTINSREFMREVAQPFLWPISVMMRRSGGRSVTDYLSADKRLVRLFCVQLYLNALHVLLAVFALLTLVLSIRTRLPEPSMLSGIQL